MRFLLQIKIWGHIFQAFAYQTWHELPLHMVFLCYSKGVLEHTFDIFTNFSHVIVTKFYVSQIFTMFLIHCMLNVEYIEINIFYNGYCKHGRKVALVWTWPSSWIVSNRKCSSNTTRWTFWSRKFVVGSHHSSCNKALALLRLHSAPQFKCLIS
jgi:hypothetical protein